MNSEIVNFNNNQPFCIKVEKIKRYPIHWHEGVTEIILPLSGDVQVTANFESLTVKEGDFHFINNMTIHSIRSSSNAVVALLYVNLDYYEKDFQHIKYMYFRSHPYIDENKPFKNHSIDFSNNYKVRLRNLLIDLLLRQLSSELSGKVIDEIGSRFIYSMIYEFHWLKFFKANERMMNPEQFDRYHRIVEFIDTNYADKITLNDVVSREFVTKTYFSHYWKKISSYTFTERLNYERVLKSEFLLLGDMSISKISEQCGFSDVKYYYQYFKRWYGCMPREHRQRCLRFNEMGADIEGLENNLLEKEIEEYAGKYLFIECTPAEDVTDSSYSDNYMNMRFLSNPANLRTSADKCIILDPFKPTNFLAESNGTISYNWHNIDLSVNMTTDECFLLFIHFHVGNVTEKQICYAIDNFLYNSIARYGMNMVKKWHFIIDCMNIMSTYKYNTIENLILDKIKNAKINYFFEFK
ncbi:MAG: helix-turn-helix domain-containing protein [Eubacteriales bacterium]|nr:helix-turn-helix domain-containing protein [Eubacteriales bacterium]MDD4121637.1 helix-turn-helix domain-containing protein [Eubacteriales bacterium]MDD4628967.1 helix-turn-helix domain-containing protein [Eubacteriales bacterium]